MLELEIKPHAGPQEQFLSSSADVVFYGGQAGGGKSFGLLLDPLRHVENPLFRGVITRNSGTEITDEGGLLDESHQLYPWAEGQFRFRHYRWQFPSGARIRFRHLENRDYVSEWKGSQIAYLGIDQIEETTEDLFFYLLSRMRSKSGVRPYVRATCNPKPGWVCDFIRDGGYLTEDGYANPDMSGVIRWFARAADNKIVWGDTPEDVAAILPNAKPQSFTFIPASLKDNPTLLEIDPDYEAKLDALPAQHRMRLKEGNWFYDEIGRRFFKPELLDVFRWTKETDTGRDGWPSLPFRHTCMAVDPSLAGDYQAIAYGGWNGDGHFYVRVYLGRDSQLGFVKRVANIIVNGSSTFPTEVWVEENKNKITGTGAISDLIRGEVHELGYGAYIVEVDGSKHDLERTPKGKGKLKQARIMGLEPIFKDGTFRFHDNDETRICVAQFREFEPGKTKVSDDGPDAVERCWHLAKQIMAQY